MKLVTASNNYINVNGSLWLRSSVVNIRLEKDKDTKKDMLVITNGLIYSYILGKKTIKKFLKENFKANSINEIKIE